MIDVIVTSDSQMVVEEVLCYAENTISVWQTDGKKTTSGFDTEISGYDSKGEEIVDLITEYELTDFGWAIEYVFKNTSTGMKLYPKAAVFNREFVNNGFNLDSGLMPFLDEHKPSKDLYTGLL